MKKLLTGWTSHTMAALIQIVMSNVHWIYKITDGTLDYSLRSYCDERITLPH